MDNVVFKNKKIIIYGTGVMAETFFDKNSDAKIIGIMDRFKIYGYWKDVPIVMWEDIKKGDADIIVIAAAMKNIQEIYYRILPFCIARGLQICGINGQNLITYFGTYTYDKKASHYKFCTNKNEILDKVKSFDVISFDIFDTLLMRSVSDPLDVFDLVEYKIAKKGVDIQCFKKVRREAELRTNGQNIYIIYLELQKILGISDEIRDLILEEELNCEEKVISPRKEIVQIFNEIKKMGKIIIITSDMYLPKKIMTKLLKKNGIEGYDEIYISCEYGRGKVKGLFDIIKKDFGQCKYLHIGDDLHADVLSALRYGIEPCGVYKSLDLFKMSSLGYSIAYVKTLNDKILLGNIIKKIFENPFVYVNEQRILNISSLTEFSYVFFLPLVLVYIMGIEELMKGNELTGVIFVSRDCYFFRKCYEKLKKEHLVREVPTFYFLSSRKLSIKSGMENIDTVVEFSECYKNEELLEQIFGEKDYESIVECSKNTREGYKKYLLNLGIDLSKKYLLCELDGHGTSHKYLNKIFENGIEAMYLSRQHCKDEVNSNKYTAVFDYYEAFEDYDCMVDFTSMLETIFSSPDKSVSDINEFGIPIYSDEVRSEEQIKLMSKIQEVLQNLIKDYYENDLIRDDIITKDMVSAIFRGILGVKLVGECRNINEWSLYDEVSGVSLDFK